MTEHSEAPWRFESAPTWPTSGDTARAGHILPHDSTAIDDPAVAYVESVGRDDLALMLASPDLLAALVVALEQTEDGLHSSPCDVPDCWVEAAEAAIAKAKGQLS